MSTVTEASVAVVTGGAGTLGTAVARALGARGVRCALLDLDEVAATRAASAVGRETGATARGIACDVTDPAQVERAWAAAEEALGPVDVVVNAAGAFAPHDFVALSLERWQQALALHLTAPFLLCQRAARSWIEAGRGGAIVNVSSSAALRAKAAGSADYGASKAGLLGLTVTLAVELGPHGIRTNAILPHSFHSPLNAARLADPAEAERARAGVPLRRVADAEEVAATVAFLALDGTYVNGALLSCDGGMAVQMP